MDQRSSHRSARRRRGLDALIGSALITVLSAVVADPALGQTSALTGDVDVGVAETSTTTSCSISGPPRPVAGARASVLVEARPQAVGQVFYAEAIIASIDQCYQQNARIEVVPPVGVELAISPTTPVRCFYVPVPAAALAGEAPAQGCPQQALMGTYGMALLRTSGSRAGLWQLEGMGPLVIDFPLRASRPLNGKPSLSCGRTANVSPPCRPDQAGDNLQVGYNVTGARDTWLAPNVGLQVHGRAAAQTPAAAPPNNTTPPSATRGPTATTPPRQTSGTTPAKLSLAAPRALRMRQALRGIPVTVQVPTDAVVRAQLRTARLRGLRNGLIARVTRRAKAGALRLRIKPSRTAARALRRKRSVLATLRVSVTAPGAASRTATARIRLRR